MLVIGLLVADDEPRAHALDHGAEQLACQPGLVHHKRIGEPLAAAVAKCSLPRPSLSLSCARGLSGLA